MKPVEISSLFESVKSTLESFGMIEEGIFVPDFLPPLPEVLYGDIDSLRKALIYVMGSGLEPTGAVTVRISFEEGAAGNGAGMLSFVFSPARLSTPVERLSPFMASVSGDAELTGGREGPPDLRIRIPLWREPVESPGETSAPCSLDAIASEIDDRGAALGILREYTKHLGEQIVRIETAVAVGDTETAHREAHSIRGGAMNIRAQRLASSAHAMEVAARKGRLENGSEMLETIRKAYREIAAYVSTLPEG